MSLYYFEALSKERGPGFSADQNLRISTAWKKRTFEALGPFYRYIETAISTAENKQAIKANWTSIDHAELLMLVPVTKIYRLHKTTTIRLSHHAPGTFRVVGSPLNSQDIEWDEPMRIVDGDRKLKLLMEPSNLVAADRIQHPDLPHRSVKVLWGFLDFSLEPAWAIIPAKSYLEVNGTPTLVQSSDGDIVQLQATVPMHAGLSFQGRNLDYELVSQTPPPTQTPLKENGEAWWLSSESPVPHAEALSPQAYTEFFNRTHLIQESNGKPLEGTPDEDLPLGIRVTDPRLGGGTIVKTSAGLRFRLERPKRNERGRHWIQLLEPEDTHEEQAGLSPLRHFFDDDIEISDNHDHVYQIAEGIESERKLCLYPKGKRKHETCLPQGEWLSIRVNTHQLKMQANAVRTLQTKPVMEQRKLIQLLEDRGQVKWPKPTKPLAPVEWQVLTDPQRDGAAEQRQFVEKALHTPDFAILEGPPGSGKTTVILELICQLIRKGKRVLLCGSTHVAIDNVLERLKAKGLMQANTILPVRIGDENRISDSVREFQLQRIVDSTQVEERLLLEAANLVCGTTIGILQHPTLKQKRTPEDYAAPIVPSFDYLIIDECSKTTFQEFLVPAMFARHWILVGDVHQLSPFTDREQLSTNIAHLELKEGKEVSQAHQAACFLLYQIAKIMPESQHFLPVICISEEVANWLALELGAGAQHDGLQGQVIGIASLAPFKSLPTRHTNCLLLGGSEEDVLAFAATDVLFITLEAYRRVQDRIPPGRTVLLRTDWPASSHAFRTMAATQPSLFPTLKRGKDTLTRHIEIQDWLYTELAERNWADEIAWRIDRTHQLRMKGKKQKESYRKAIEDLMPRAISDREDLLNRIDTIGQVALPSILELLERGLELRRQATPSTLSNGFSESELAHRHTRLSYQQRMHPDISAFPRHNFYEGEALKDMHVPNIADNRVWGYGRHWNRSSWLNVKGKTQKNYNLDEVMAMSDALSDFLQFARKTPPPQGRDQPGVWEVACLTFYRGQEARLRERLRILSDSPNSFSKFVFKGEAGVEIHVLLHTVDKFQGQEADIVFLSMVQTFRDGFLDSPNRLNVAITRARFQLLIIGCLDYFLRSRSDDLRALAHHHRNATLEHSK
jgi:hypothetical protein